MCHVHILAYVPLRSGVGLRTRSSRKAKAKAAARPFAAQSELPIVMRLLVRSEVPGTPRGEY